MLEQVGDADANAKAEAVHNVAADGNIILIVDAPSPAEIRIRVHSVIMRNASKPFAAMLGPNFKEGHALLDTSRVGLVEINLPEDDLNALLIICNVVHGRSDAKMAALGSDQVLEIAIAADKWDAAESLLWARKYWLKSGPEHAASPEQMWQMMLAAYCFKDEEGFEKTTSCLVKNYGRSYLLLDSESGTDTAVLMIIRLLLEESRAVFRSALQRVTMALVSSYHTTDQNPLWNPSHKAYALGISGATGSEVLLAQSVTIAFQAIDKIYDTYERAGRPSQDANVSVRAKARGEMQHAMQHHGGLKLECVSHPKATLIIR